MEVALVNGLSYVLVTPARNEAFFIEDTIRSVLAQTTRPMRWVIVSDGSTDGTDEIAERYAREVSWIEFLRMPFRPERDFAGKVRARPSLKESVTTIIGSQTSSTFPVPASCSGASASK